MARGPIRISGNEVSGNEIGLSIDYGPSRIAQNQITGRTASASVINGGNGACRARRRS